MDESAMDNSKDGKSIASLVPQIFFDLIARLIPGAMIIGVFACVYLGPGEYWQLFVDWFAPSVDKGKQFPSITLLFALSIVASYVLSIILWGLWFGYCQAFRSVFRLIDRVDPETGIKFENPQARVRYYESYCEIKKHIPQAGSRITKVKAEIHMSATLSAGFVAAFAMNGYLYYFSTDSSDARVYIALGLAIALIATECARWHFRNHMKQSIRLVAAQLQEGKRVLVKTEVGWILGTKYLGAE